MTPLDTLSFDKTECRQQWNELKLLLASAPILKERKDILPFFKARPDLCSLISLYFPKLSECDCYYNEFPIGDFVADLIVGDRSTCRYVIVEFEDAHSESIFAVGGRKTPIWAPRLEGAFSQLMDWLWKLDDQRSTKDFLHSFGNASAHFSGLIVTGKDVKHAPQEIDRLKWRIEKLALNSIPIDIVTFDELCAATDRWLSKYYGV